MRNSIRLIKPKICIRPALSTVYCAQNSAMQILPKAACGGVNPASPDLSGRSGSKSRFCYCKIWVKLVSVLVLAIILLSAVSAQAWDRRGYGHRRHRDARDFWQAAAAAFVSYYTPRVVVREVVAYPDGYYYDTGRACRVIRPQPNYNRCDGYSTIYVAY